MTLVLPGSAQLSAGNKRVGRIALRTWAVLWGLLLCTGLLALVWRSGAVSLFTAPLTLRVVQIGLIVLGIGWGLLLLDAWRIARPPELARRHRPLFALLSLVLVGLVVGGMIAASSVVSAQRDLVSTVFAGGGQKEAIAGRYNILLMGGDAGVGPGRTAAGQHDGGQRRRRDRADRVDQPAAQPRGRAVPGVLAAAQEASRTATAARTTPAC